MFIHHGGNFTLRRILFNLYLLALKHLDVSLYKATKKSSYIKVEFLTEKDLGLHLYMENNTNYIRCKKSIVISVDPKTYEKLVGLYFMDEKSGYLFKEEDEFVYRIVGLNKKMIFYSPPYNNKLTFTKLIDSCNDHIFDTDDKQKLIIKEDND